MEMAHQKWKSTALIVMGMQHDFVADDGLASIAVGKAILPNVIKAVEIARQREIRIVWVVREHDPSGKDIELFRRHWYSDGRVGPVIKGSPGAELVDGLEMKEGDYKVVKKRFSAFFATPLHSYLQDTGVDSLVITGLVTPNCVRQTAFDAVALDYPSVTVIADATAAVKPEVHSANIYDMQKVKIATPTLQEWADDEADDA